MVFEIFSNYFKEGKDKRFLRFFQTTSKTTQKGSPGSFKIIQKQNKNFPDSFKLLQKLDIWRHLDSFRRLRNQSKNGLWNSFELLQRREGQEVPEILSKYFKNNRKMVPENLSNYFINQTEEAPEILSTTSKTKQKGFPRFFQTT